MANALAPKPVNALVQGLYGAAQQGAGWVAGRYNALKTDPWGDIKNTAQKLVTEADARSRLFSEAFADPRHPLRITNEEAAQHLSDVYGSAAMSFAPAGIIGYHGTTKAFDKFKPKKADVYADDNVAILNALGPHFTHSADDVNNFMTSAFGESEKWTTGWAKKFPHMDDVFPPKANIRKVQVEMKNPFDIGGESFINDLMAASSGRDLINMGRIAPENVKLADALVAAKHPDATTFAKNIRATLQKEGYDGIKYTGEYSDLMDVPAFVPFNTKSIESAWGPAK